MIKVTNSAPKQMTVFFGNGTIQVGTVANENENLIGVLLSESIEKKEIGSYGKIPFIQDRPLNTESLATRSVILSFPNNDIKSIDIVIDTLQEIKAEIISTIKESEG